MRTCLDVSGALERTANFGGWVEGVEKNHVRPGPLGLTLVVFFSSDPQWAFEGTLAGVDGDALNATANNLS